MEGGPPGESVPAFDTKMKAVVVAGGKYAFRGVYVPFLRELSRVYSIRLYLMDFPEDYPIEPLLDDLRKSSVIESYAMAPANSTSMGRSRTAWSSVSRPFSGESLPQ